MVAALVGLVVSLASWAFLESVHQIQGGVFGDLPRELGYDGGAPVWRPPPRSASGSCWVPRRL